MRFVLIFIFGILSNAASKSNTKSLTESMGQEVIEIGTPLKDLPPDLEEEPSAEADEADKATSTTFQAATPRESKKDTAIESRRKIKDIDKIDSVKQEDDEARIEKELAEMYKDTDYKADSAESIQQDKHSTSLANYTEKPIGRMRNNFRFHPDNNNPKEVERFRTSIDDISCANNKLVGTPVANSGYVPTICRLVFWGFFIVI